MAKTRGAKTKAGAFQPSSDTPLIIPCNAGANAYVNDPTTGRTQQFATSDPAFIELLVAIANSGFDARAKDELDGLVDTYAGAWVSVRDRFDEATTVDEVTEPTAEAA